MENLNGRTHLRVVPFVRVIIHLGYYSLTPAYLFLKILVAQCTLCDHMDCSLSGSSVHGILQARILEWVAISFSRGSSRPRDWTQVSCIASRLFTSEPPGKPLPLSGWQLFPGMLMSYCFQSTSSKDHENILKWGYRYLQTANNGTNQNAECQEPTSRAPTVCSGEVIKNMDFNHTDLVESCFCHLSVKLSKLANLSLNFFFWLCKAKTVQSLTGWVSSSWGWPICGQLLANCRKNCSFYNLEMG